MSALRHLSAATSASERLACHRRASSSPRLIPSPSLPMRWTMTRRCEAASMRSSPSNRLRTTSAMAFGISPGIAANRRAGAINASALPSATGGLRLRTDCEPRPSDSANRRPPERRPPFQLGARLSVAWAKWRLGLSKAEKPPRATCSVSAVEGKDRLTGRAIRPQLPMIRDPLPYNTEVSHQTAANRSSLRACPRPQQNDRRSPLSGPAWRRPPLCGGTFEFTPANQPTRPDFACRKDFEGAPGSHAGGSCSQKRKLQRRQERTCYGPTIAGAPNRNGTLTKTASAAGGFPST